MVVAIVIVAVVVVGLIAWFVLRKPRQEPGIVGFRQHIDALSPESRQEMKDRMREQQAGAPGPDRRAGLTWPVTWPSTWGRRTPWCT